MGFSVPPVRAAGGGPSEGQLKYADDLARKNSRVIPEETLKSGKALSLWIEGVVGAKGQTTPVSTFVPKGTESVKKKAD